MNNHNTPPPAGYLYLIRVQGRLTGQWSEWLEGLAIQTESDSTTLQGFLPDQAALLGVLNKLHALNLVLLSVTRGAPGDGIAH